MKIGKKIKKRTRLLQGVSILVVLLLVTVSIPNAEASASGRNEHGKYYWNVNSTADLQIEEESAQWSVKNSDEVVDHYEFWGEIRMSQQPLYAEPHISGDLYERDDLGYVRLFVQPELPQQPSGFSCGLRRWDLRLIFVVHAPDAHGLPYDLDGFSTRYMTSVGHEIQQIETGSGWEDELGGVNSAAERTDSLAMAWMEDVFDYAVGQTIQHDEVDLAINMIRTWQDHDSSRPNWNGNYNHHAGRHRVYFDEDDDSYDGRYMAFWDKITLQIPGDGDGIPQESFLNIGIDGYAAGYEYHDIDFTHTSWHLNIDVTDDLEDAPPSGGGGGGGGSLIPLGEPGYEIINSAEVYREKDNFPPST